MKVKVLGILIFVTNVLWAQEAAHNDSINSSLKEIRSELKALKRLKVSGYVQAQWQLASEKGIKSYAGGNFADDVNNRFSVRRGRVKFSYDYNLAKAVMQFDITEKGVDIKDAYLSLTEPWLKTATLTGGVFDRPFGYEISYSSGTRETPERSRVFQVLFPKERETGAKLTLKAPSENILRFITLEAGLFNGNGIAADTDSNKDFIGHLHAGNAYRQQILTWGGGVSYYKGGFASPSDTIYKMNDGVFVANAIEPGEKINREYIGVDLQLSYEWLPGKTALRAEYLWGTQPGTGGNSASPAKDKFTSHVYSRNFYGYYVYFIQNIAKTPLQVVVKYDVYDPNRKIKDDEISNATDLKYTTWGLGLNYQWNKNVKVTAYYDIVKNETSLTLNGFDNDLSDNVFTLRIQYRF